MIKIYFGGIEEIINKFDEIFYTLPKYRQNKINELKTQNDKYLSLLAGYMLHKGLLELGINNLEKDIYVDDYGKEHLPNDKYYFSISHSGTKAIVVIGDHPVGCDLEFSDRIIYDSIISKFSSDEQDLIKNSQNPNEETIRIWTIKESYMKLLGKGLKLPLDSFSVIKKGDLYFIKEDTKIVIKIEKKDKYVFCVTY